MGQHNSLATALDHLFLFEIHSNTVFASHIYNQGNLKSPLKVDFLNYPWSLKIKLPFCQQLNNLNIVAPSSLLLFIMQSLKSLAVNMAYVSMLCLFFVYCHLLELYSCCFYLFYLLIYPGVYSSHVSLLLMSLGRSNIPCSPPER